MEERPLTLAQRIFNARTARRESQEVFAARFGVKRLAVMGWEKGAAPNSKHLPELERFLGEHEASQAEGITYQIPLPFDEAVSFVCKVSPRSSDSVHFVVQINRRAG